MTGEQPETWPHWLMHDASGFFTAALVIVGAVQLVLFIWQLRLIRTSLDDAKISADAAADAAKAAARQAHVAEETLAKIERPYLFAFNVSALSVETYEAADGDYSWLKVIYSIANYGKIPAIIKSAQVGLSAFTEPLSPPRLGYNHALIVSPILAPGEVRSSIEESLLWDGQLQRDEDGREYPALGDNDLFFWVIISYRGPFTDQHETRTCWRYDLATGRFIGPHGGSEFSGEK
jgi:hypothetical protein